jgi:hypothetical protein
MSDSATMLTLDTAASVIATASAIRKAIGN